MLCQGLNSWDFLSLPTARKIALHWFKIISPILQRATVDMLITSSKMLFFNIRPQPQVEHIFCGGHHSSHYKQ